MARKCFSAIKYASALLAFAASAAVSASTEWRSEPANYNGTEHYVVYGFLEHNTALFFDFLKKEPGCLSGVTQRLPLEQPTTETITRTGALCTLHVDDGVKVKKHGYPCKIHAYAGSDFISVLFDATPAALKPLMFDIQNAERIGFSSNADSEPLWQGAKGLKAELSKGYGYCGNDLPVASR